MKYVFEKGCGMPLCGYNGEQFYKFENGEIIENESVIKFIQNGLNKKTMSIKAVDLSIYRIIDREKRNLVGYVYFINNVPNYLDIFKQPLTRSERTYMIDKIMQNYYIQELVWGEDNG